MANIKEEEKIVNGLRLIVREKEEAEPLLDLAESVSSYIFKMNSRDDAESKDSNIMVELQIDGVYRAEVADAASQFMSEWALEKTAAAYKYVELMRFDEEIIRKRYVFPKAFIVDYTENAESNSDNPSFTLFIKENKDDRNKYKMYVNEPLPAEKNGEDK